MNLKAWRRARGITQTRLSAMTGLDRAYLSLVENQHRTMSLDNICKIAEALDIHPRQLLEDPGE